MNEKIFISLFVIVIFFWFKNPAAEYYEMQNNHLNSEEVFGHHNAEDPMYIDESIYFSTSFNFFVIKIHLLIPSEYQYPILKPPISS
jgi:hypothetical protein